MPLTASREHEFCYGHRVVGHEGKCQNLHGHNAKVIFTIAAFDGSLDQVGRVIDFSVIKDKLCQWLEDNWDHKMLLWDKDPIASMVVDDGRNLGAIRVPFNPTAENLAKHLLHVVGPDVFSGWSVCLISVKFFETSKCSVEAYL